MEIRTDTPIQSSHASVALGQCFIPVLSHCEPFANNLEQLANLLCDYCFGQLSLLPQYRTPLIFEAQQQ